MDIEAVKATLKADEGFRSEAYQDHLGYWTIGYGRMVDGRLGGGITKAEAETLLENDIKSKARELDRAISWWRGLPSGVMEAVINMAFQMGVPRLSGFKKTLAALEAHDFETAANEALDSRWARQTPNRANRVADMIRQGE